MLNESELDKIKFNSNYLENVLFRLDFSPILKLKEQLSVEFQDSLKLHLLILDKEVSMFNEQINISNSKKVTNTEYYKMWLFHDKEKTINIEICYQFLLVKFTKYCDFKSFKKIVKYVLNSFQNLYNDIDYKRVGLRYINTIHFKEGNPLEWSSFIDDSLVKSIENFIGDKSEISRAMSQFTINKLDSTILFNYGIYNSEFPNSISRKEFILDYDCYTNDIDEGDNILSIITKFNKEILLLFLNSITSEFKNILNRTGGQNEKLLF